MFIATTKVTTYRGTAANAAGDDIDANVDATRVLIAKPASIIEKSRRVQDPATLVWRTIRYAVGRLTYGHDVAIGDRVKDLTTSAIYIVDEVNRTPRTIAGASELMLDLRITGNTAP